MPAKITFFFEKRKHFLKKSFIRCPIFQFHTSIECKGFENAKFENKKWLNYGKIIAKLSNFTPFLAENRPNTTNMVAGILLMCDF